MSITALLELTLKPESVETSNELIRDVLTATRAFAGNEGIEVIVDAKDPAHVLIVEHWESMAADTAYRKWRASPEGASALGKILAGPPVLTHWNDAPGV